MSAPFLQMRGIVKSFPGVKALDNVSFEAEQGETHALIGENGAGKSTLVKILSGALRPDSGDISIAGQTVHFRSTRDAIETGIAIIYQELALCPDLSVAENIFLGREGSRFGWYNKACIEKRAEEAMQVLGTDMDVRQAIRSLKVGDQQLVEIARAISLNARIIIMDEPTSALTSRETSRLFSIIAQLRKSGVTVLFISHRLEEIARIAQRATILRDGRIVGTCEVETTPPKTFITMMVGHEVQRHFPSTDRKTGPVILEVRGLTMRHPYLDTFILQDISLSLHQGEILGLAGLLGSGRSELLMALFGNPRGPVRSGSILISGQEVHLNSPRDAMANYIALVPGNRNAEGLFLKLAASYNISISALKEIKNKYSGILRKKNETAFISPIIKKLDIRIPHPEAEVEVLSGGNQQKVLLARGLLTTPRVLMLNDPTRGIDVGTKEEIYRLIHALAGEGMGLLLISSELSEIIALSDRILVMNDGRISGSYSKGVSERQIMAAATSSEPESADKL